MADLATERQPLSGKEKRELDIEIEFLSGLIERDPEYVEALQLLGDDFTKRGQFNDGLKIDEQLSRLLPEDSMVFYNLACSYSNRSHRRFHHCTQEGRASRLRRFQVDGHRPGPEQSQNRSALPVDPPSTEEKTHCLIRALPDERHPEWEVEALPDCMF